MQLPAAFLVAFGPVLASCQLEHQSAQLRRTSDIPIAPSTIQQYVPPQVDPQTGELSKGSNDGVLSGKCQKTPMMPQTFFAERRFASFLNTIVFTDSRGHEFGYVKSWFMDWQNPFGYPGASFYMRVPEPLYDDKGIWKVDPDRASLSFETAQEIGEMPDPSQMTDQQAKIWQAKLDWDYRNGVGADSDGYWLVGTMIGKHDDKTRLGEPWPKDWPKIAAGDPQADQMNILDCHGKPRFQAENGVLKSHKYKDATYYTDVTGAANQVIFQDLSIPKQGLVELIMKQPCKPFPPFCAGMGPSNWWFLYGDKWEGRITQPGYNITAGIQGLQSTVSAGAAADMNFLTLYSSYQYSNTRWSPLMFLILNVLLWMSIICCINRCCCSGQPWLFACQKSAARQVAPDHSAEETQKLMSTKEVEVKPTQGGGSMWSCCRRPGGKSVETQLPASPAHGGH